MWLYENRTWFEDCIEGTWKVGFNFFVVELLLLLLEKHKVLLLFLLRFNYSNWQNIRIYSKKYFF